MEYMSGGSLGDRIRNGKNPMKEEEARRITCEILRGLAAAHRVGIVHRDIKPPNILFSSNGVAKLGDFGISKMIEATRIASTVIGTPPYMAPEHLLGKATLRSDIYSVGVVLYEITTGRRAFEGESDFVIMKKVERGDFPPPRVINPKISYALEAVILRAMARDLSERFERCEDFATALAGLTEGAGTKLIRKVPKLTGKVLGEAEATARAAGILVKVRNWEDNPAPPGRVVWQSIDAGQRLQENATLEVTVSRGPAPVLIPELTGKPFEKAKEIAQAAGINFKVRRREHHPAASEGVVIWQSARPGSQFEPGMTLETVVSLGPKPQTLVPDIGGALKNDAEHTLKAIDLKILVVGREYDERVGTDAIIRQTPVAGTAVEPGATTVEVVVSKGPHPVAVADLAGMPFSEAESVANAGGLKLIATVQKYDPLSTLGTILEQKPRSGTLLPRGSNVDVVVSLGPKPTVAVPSVIGMAAREAQVEAGKAGFSIKVKSRAFDDKVAPGLITTQEPASGIPLEPGAVIYVVTSRGPAPKALPDLTGMLLQETESLTSTLGFAVKVSRSEYHPGIPSGKIISQGIKPGTLIRQGKSVKVVTSLGPEPARVAPALTGLFLGDAETKAGTEGLTIKARRIYSASVPEGMVINQTVAAGSLLKEGATVRVVVSKGPAAPSAPWKRKYKITAGFVALFLITSSFFGIAWKTGLLKSKGKGTNNEVKIPAGEPYSATAAKKPAYRQGIPDVTGATEPEARKRLKGFDVKIERQESDTVGLGRVISQRPPPGAETAAGTTVTVVVSSGKRRREPEDSLPVPPVAGMPASNARARLGNAGFGVRTVERESNTVANGYVISRTPDRARSGAIVTLVVSSGPPEPPPPEFVFCPKCGAKYSKGTKFCPIDTTPLKDLAQK